MRRRLTAAISIVMLSGVLAPSNLGTRSALADGLSINYSNFSSTAGLTLNGNATQAGSALRLTPAQTYTIGSAFANSPLDTRQSFQSEFSFNLHDGSNPYADGIVFTVQNAPHGPYAIGNAGEALGYGGFSPSVGVEFDIFQNQYDPNNNHVGIVKNGDVTNYLGGANTPNFTLYGETISVWVEYTAAASLLQVFVNNTPSKPALPLVSTTINIAATVGPAAYAGFTGATGAFDADQDILSWQFSATSSCTTNCVGLPPQGITDAQSYLSTVFADSQTQFSDLALLGEPVNVIFGNFLQQHTDLALPGLGMPVRMTRTYNSGVLHNSILGFGWNMTFDDRVTATNAGTVTVKRDDGRIDTYAVNENGSLQPPAGSVDTLVHNLSGGYTLTTRQHLVYTFSSAGLLQTVADADGNTDRLSYTGILWTGVTDATGRVWRVGYNGAGQIGQISDPTGRSVRYGYDGSGNLVTVTDAAGDATSYAYDRNHKLTQITDANGHLYLSNVYDANGRVVTQTDSRGTHEFTYFDGLSVYTNPVGDSTSVLYNAQFRPTERIDPLANTKRLSYTPPGLVSQLTDPNGNNTFYSYDARGNLTSDTDPSGDVTRVTYDGRDNVLSLTDPLHHTTTFGYNADNHPISLTDSLGHTLTEAYDSHGLPISATDALHGTARYGFDAAGDLISATDPLGNMLRLQRDSAGRIVKRIDPLGHVLSYSYDAVNRPLTVTAPDGGMTTYAYDAVGNRTATTDPLGNTTQFSYDNANGLTQITDAVGNATNLTYDAAGRRTSVTYPDGNAWLLQYDADSRLQAITSPMGRTASLVFDPAGNILSVTDPLGRSTAYTYDADNQALSRTDAAGNITQFGHDADGNLISTTDANGHTTSYGYNALNQRNSTTDALGHVTRATHDAAGNLASLTNGAGQAIVYGRDADGRLTSVASAAGTTQYSYDAAGNRLVMHETGKIPTLYRYDAANRLKLVLFPSGVNPVGILTYAYDLAGNRVSMSQLGTTTHYSYNQLNRLARIQASNGATMSYSYDQADRLNSELFGNGVTTALNYDGDGRLQSLDTNGQSGLIQHVGYTVDNANNVVAENGTNLNASYQYDQLDRLISASNTVTPDTGPIQSHNYSYSYDAVGNRLTSNEDGTTTNYSYDAANRIVTAGAKTYQYDNAGRLTSDGNSTYTYNPFNLLTRISGSVNATYTYDGNGNEIGEQVNQDKSQFVLDTASYLQRRITTLTNQGTEIDTYGAGQVAQSTRGAGLRYVHTDLLGSTRLFSDTSGTPSNRSAYAPFGARLSGTGNPGFAGSPSTDVGHLQSLQARQYSTDLGRFLTPDPLGATVNSYAYAYNNPTNLVDPTGLLAGIEPWAGQLFGEITGVPQSLGPDSSVAGGTGGSSGVLTGDSGQLTAATATATRVDTGLMTTLAYTDPNAGNLQGTTATATRQDPGTFTVLAYTDPSSSNLQGTTAAATRQDSGIITQLLQISDTSSISSSSGSVTYPDGSASTGDIPLPQDQNFQTLQGPGFINNGDGTATSTGVTQGQDVYITPIPNPNSDVTIPYGGDASTGGYSPSG